MSTASTIPTQATPDVCTVGILVDGTQIPGRYQVLSVTVIRDVNRIPSATISIKDGEAAQGTFSASDDTLFIPGSEVEIQLGYRSQNESVFKGLIIRHGLKVRSSGSVLTIECKDVAVKMTQVPKSAYFVDKKDSAVIEELIDAYGITSDVDPTDVEATSLVQYDATDWDFVVCRAEANGRLVLVNDGTIAVKAPDVSTEPVVSVGFGSTLLELDIEIDARTEDEGIATEAWSHADQEIGRTDGSEPTSSNNGNLDAATLAEVHAGGVRTLKHGGAISEGERQAWADAYLVKQRLARVRGRAVFNGFAGVRPGNMIEIDGIGDRFKGALFVSGVRHAVANGKWHTSVQVGLDVRSFASLFDISTMPAAGLLPSVPGLQIGKVTALEGDPDGEDRIRVRIPMINADDDGIWARLSTLDAGEERGTFFRPEIDDEVIVGFISGDPRHAIVLGMLHSSAKPNPEPLSDDNHKKGYVSREKLKLTFDDNDKIIHVETPAGNKITLTEADTAIVIEDQNGNSITMNSDGITMESIKDIVLKAAADIKLEGVNIEGKASSSMKLSGSGSAELTGATAKVEGSGTTTIKGGLVQIN